MAKGKGKFTLGAIVGIAAGVVAGILAAPKSGEETRNDIKQKANRLKNSANQKAGQAKRSANQKADQAKEIVTEAADDALDKAEDLKTRTKRAIKGAKSEFNKKPKR